MIKPATLWRAFFCAVGIVLIIVGIECLLIDSAVLAIVMLYAVSLRRPAA